MGWRALPVVPGGRCDLLGTLSLSAALGAPEPGRKEFPDQLPRGPPALLNHGGEPLARILTSHLSSGGVNGVKRKTYTHAPLFSGTPRQNRALLKMRKSSER